MPDDTRLPALVVTPGGSRPTHPNFGRVLGVSGARSPRSGHHTATLQMQDEEDGEKVGNAVAAADMESEPVVQNGAAAADMESGPEVDLRVTLNQWEVYRVVG